MKREFDRDIGNDQLIELRINQWQGELGLMRRDLF